MGRGGRGVSCPMLASICSAVRREVMTANTLRVPPQRHVQTSMLQVRCSRVAQSSRGRLGGAPSLLGVVRSIGPSGLAGGGGCITWERS